MGPFQDVFFVRIWWKYIGYHLEGYQINPGWWCNNHLEKYEFVNGKDYPIYYIWKVNNVPNHHPVIMVNNMVSPLIFHPQMNNDEHALIQLVSEFKKMFYVYLDHIYI
jgi:hypothetical protein